MVAEAKPLAAAATCPGHQPGVHLVQSAGVAEQDQRNRSGCRSRRPQDAGDLAEGELALEDAVVEALFGGELHGRAFRECSWTALPDDLSPGRDP